MKCRESIGKVNYFKSEPVMDRVRSTSRYCRSHERTRGRIDALVLVSQISRSGGARWRSSSTATLRSTRTWEVRVWHPRKWDWPALDPDASADEWLEALSDPKWAKIAEEGFAKAGRNPFAKSERHPFTFSDETQRALFLELVASRLVTRSRDVLDCWFTSFFACWRDREPSGRELSITGFMPRVATSRESIERFAADYPDGALISILRDPAPGTRRAASSISTRSGHRQGGRGWLEDAGSRSDRHER
jgi:hypothetical protein